jgi:hypothetical protein
MNNTLTYNGVYTTYNIIGDYCWNVKRKLHSSELLRSE